MPRTGGRVRPRGRCGDVSRDCSARGGADIMTHPASVSEGGEVTECRSRSMATRAGRHDEGRRYDCLCPGRVSGSASASAIGEMLMLASDLVPRRRGYRTCANRCLIRSHA